MATSPVIFGDKERKDISDKFNVGHCLDLGEAGASPWGTDSLYETKVVAPLTKTHHAGRGSKTNAGTPEDIGHTHAFGNVEERFNLEVLGCKARGKEADGFFDHSTGKGWVKTRPCYYDDALLVKNNQVIPVIVETLSAASAAARIAC